MEKKDAQTKVLILMACSLVFRIVAATTIELGNDEVYYALYPRYPAWSYFDHPAMIAWVVRILNGGQVPHTAWALRLPALLFGTLNLYLAFLIGTRLKNPRCGYYAALLYAASLYVSVICGVFILPDTAQSFFWLLSLLVLVRIFDTQNPRWLWLVFGLTHASVCPSFLNTTASSSGPVPVHTFCFVKGNNSQTPSSTWAP